MTYLVSYVSGDSRTRDILVTAKTYLAAYNMFINTYPQSKTIFTFKEYTGKFKNIYNEIFDGDIILK